VEPLGPQFEHPPPRLICAQSVFVDDADNLWILAPAAPMLMSIIPDRPKLVKVDLKTIA
jgi:hypothetical protein